MTYEDLKHINLPLYKLARRRRDQAQSGLVTDDSMPLVAGRAEGGFSFERTPETGNLWGYVVEFKGNPEILKQNLDRTYKNAYLRGLAIMATEENDEETWKFIIEKFKEHLD